MLITLAIRKPNSVILLHLAPASMRCFKSILKGHRDPLDILWIMHKTSPAWVTRILSPFLWNCSCWADLNFYQASYMVSDPKEAYISSKIEEWEDGYKGLDKSKMHVWENNHWKDSKIQNSTGYVWACMYAYAFTQILLMYSSNTEGSWLCYSTKKQKLTLKMMAPCHQGLRGLKYTPFNKVDNLLLILYLLSALCSKSFKGTQLVNSYKVPTKPILHLHDHIRDMVYDPQFRKELTKRERVQSVQDDAAKLLAIAKLEPSRRVNSDLCIPDLPLHWQTFQGPSLKAEGSFVWTTISHVRTTPPKWGLKVLEKYL